MRAINFIKHFLLALPGWHTRRKLAVIQSDDWGATRMPSVTIRNKLAEHPLIDASSSYCHYDTLASPKDLELLFEVLTSVKDSVGNYPVLTANCVLANPNFQKIKESGYTSYHYHNLRESFERYGKVEALTLWEEGMASRIFHPQYHGREHVNVPAWLRSLRNEHSGVAYAFEHEVFGVNFKDISEKKDNFQAAWDFNHSEDKEEVNASVLQGLNLFEEHFGFKSLTTIAPSYTWSHEVEELLNRNGVLAMQSILYQKVPLPGSDEYQRNNRLLSVKSRKSQIRNAFFEVLSVEKPIDLSEIYGRAEAIFKAGKPLIIGSHRRNFIGGHSERYRDQNLRHLGEILSTLVKKWPDLEFVSSENLAQIMHGQQATVFN